MTPQMTHRDIARINEVLTSSFGQSHTPCPDQGHYVSSIDLSGEAAAAIVEFSDCSGMSFTDVYVLQKQNDDWAIDSKAWDSHAYL
ncbi:MAG: nuclear transport factor 2 family protein [Paracoccaceae bacterium]